MTLDLLMVGTVHIDPKGPERLWKILNYFKPERIGVEFTEAGAQQLLHFMEKRKSGQLTDEQILDLVEKEYETINRETALKLININVYEFSVSQWYCLENKIPLLFCDSTSVGKVASFSPVFKKYFSMTLSQLQEEASIHYTKERHFEDFSPQEFQEYVIERDRYTEGKLRELSGKVVYVGGLSHFFGNYPNLYEQLNDVNPTRMKLIESDTL